MRTPEKILTAKEVAEMTGFTISWVRKVVREKLITYYKPNRNTLFFKRSDVLEYLLSNKYPSKSMLDVKDTARSYFSEVR